MKRRARRTLAMLAMAIMAGAALVGGCNRSSATDTSATDTSTANGAAPSGTSNLARGGSKTTFTTMPVTTAPGGAGLDQCTAVTSAANDLRQATTPAAAQDAVGRLLTFDPPAPVRAQLQALLAQGVPVTGTSTDEVIVAWVRSKCG